MEFCSALNKTTLPSPTNEQPHISDEFFFFLIAAGRGTSTEPFYRHVVHITVSRQTAGRPGQLQVD